MTLPLIPIAAGATGVAAGVALNHWLSDPGDVWENKATFNARMRDMFSLAQALNDGFATCPTFMAKRPQLESWRGARDNFGKFYREVGTLKYTSPNAGEIAQAKSYASKLYFWTGEYNRVCSKGAPLDAPGANTDPYAPLTPTQPTDWLDAVKWGAIGIGGLIALKTLSDVFGKRR
jgi:hypothetical protein